MRNFIIIFVILIMALFNTAHGYDPEYKVCEFELKYDKTEDSYWNCVEGMKPTIECEHELKDSCDPEVGLPDGTSCLMQSYCCQAEKGMEDRSIEEDCKRGE